MKRIVLLLLCFVVLLSGCSEAADPAHTVIYGRSEHDATNFLVPVIDPTTGALGTIDTTHLELHEGDVFTTCYIDDMANGGNITILLRTPNTTGLDHMVFEVTSEGEALFEFFELSTVTNNGTGLSVFDRNRSTNNTALTKLFHTPTITALGTLVCQRQWGSGKGVGGGTRSAEEWILAANTNYIIRISNKVTTNNEVSIGFEWYRHEPEE